jgi:hypothetical protein
MRELNRKAFRSPTPESRTTAWLHAQLSERARVGGATPRIGSVDNTKNRMATILRNVRAFLHFFVRNPAEIDICHSVKS